MSETQVVLQLDASWRVGDKHSSTSKISSLSLKLSFWNGCLRVTFCSISQRPCLPDLRTADENANSKCCRGKKRKKQSISLASYKSLAVNILCLWHLVIQPSAPSLNMHIAPLSCIPSCGYLGTNMTNCGGKKREKKRRGDKCNYWAANKNASRGKIEFCEHKMRRKTLGRRPLANPVWLMSRKCNIKTARHCLFYCRRRRKWWKKTPKQRYHVLPI